MIKAFDFKDQLGVGDKGESLFALKYPRELAKYEGREYDFTVKATGQKLELKTDTYSMEKSNNFFMERFSDVTSQKPGGPWRADQDKIDIFCYLFAMNNTWFEFTDMPGLVKELERIVKPRDFIYIKNKGWTTGGYKVNRKALEPFYTKHTF